MWSLLLIAVAVPLRSLSWLCLPSLTLPLLLAIEVALAVAGAVVAVLACHGCHAVVVLVLLAVVDAVLLWLPLRLLLVALAVIVGGACGR